jgi:hypothetical protein
LEVRFRSHGKVFLIDWLALSGGDVGEMRHPLGLEVVSATGGIFYTSGLDLA